MKYRYAHPIAAALAVSAIAMGGPATGAKATNTCPLPSFGPGAAYHPQIDPANFSPNVDNSYMPLTPGTTLVYTGTKDGKSALTLCEQWAGLRGQYVAHVQAEHTAYQLEQWFSSAVWQAAFSANTPLRVDASYGEISVAFLVATSGDAASILNARMLDRACAAAD